jgi:hypothetical protein
MLQLGECPLGLLEGTGNDVAVLADKELLPIFETETSWDGVKFESCPATCLAHLRNLEGEGEAVGPPVTFDCVDGELYVAAHDLTQDRVGPRGLPEGTELSCPQIPSELNAGEKRRG